MPPAQDAPQALPYPTIHRFEHGVLAVLEVFKPASRALIDFPDDSSQASGSAALGLIAYGLFEFIQALRAGPTVVSLEVVPQKVEPAFLAGIDDARFGRMQRQYRCVRPVAQLLQHLLGLLLVLAEDDEVVRVAHHLPPLSSRELIQRV